jgi:outer membrane receptor protein involved in Fe transport
VEAGDTTLQAAGSQAQEVAASVLFRDGQPLTGQSDHIANVQIGFSDEDNLSEQTLLLNYASNRSTQRGTASLPDLVEKPGFTIDLVLRQGLNIAGLDLEAKFEARNLTNVKYQEFQSLNGSRIDNNTYVRGRSFSFGLQANF